MRQSLLPVPWAWWAMATFFEANRPKVVSIEIPLSRLPQSWDGFRIAQLSDLHYDPHFSAVPIAKAVDLVNGLQPDLIVLTGDFVTAPISARSVEQHPGCER